MRHLQKSSHTKSRLAPVVIIFSLHLLTQAQLLTLSDQFQPWNLSLLNVLSCSRCVSLQKEIKSTKKKDMVWGQTIRKDLRIAKAQSCSFCGPLRIAKHCGLNKQTILAIS